MTDRKDKTASSVGEYITSAETAKILGLTQRRIAQLCTEGALDGIKVARRWLVKRDSVYAYQGGR